MTPTNAFIGIFVLGLCIGIFWPRDEWRGFFYPNRYDLTHHVETGKFKSLEACRDATVAQGENLGIPEYKYDYECGLNCEAAPYGGYVCEETLE